MGQYILVAYTPYWEDNLLSLYTLACRQNRGLQNTRECTDRQLHYCVDCKEHWTRKVLGCMGQLFLWDGEGLENNLNYVALNKALCLTCWLYLA